MDFKFNIEVIASSSKQMPFPPFVTFRFEQIETTPQLMTDSEIDYHVDSLIKSAEKLRKEAKKALKDANRDSAG